MFFGNSLAFFLVEKSRPWRVLGPRQRLFRALNNKNGPSGPFSLATADIAQMMQVRNCVVQANNT